MKAVFLTSLPDKKTAYLEIIKVSSGKINMTNGHLLFKILFSYLSIEIFQLQDMRCASELSCKDSRIFYATPQSMIVHHKLTISAICKLNIVRIYRYCPITVPLHFIKYLNLNILGWRRKNNTKYFKLQRTKFKRGMLL